MKKSFLALALIGVFAISCGQKETKTVEDVTTTVEQETTQEKVVEVVKHKVVWTAFKTPEKVGVKGSFDKVALTYANPDAASITEALNGATYEIDTKSVNSNDPGRDSKLSGYFFEKMAGNIHGTFHEFKDGKVATTIVMNGVEQSKELTYEVNGNTVVIKGGIDIIADFNAEPAFQSLHEICKDLHEGKSWSDVEFEVTIEK